MSDLRRLIGLARSHWPWLAAGALFGVLAVGSNVALMALSAYLISKAAIASSVAELALAITGVRVLAISRAGFRYLERYTTHRAMFRILTSLRAWFYAAVEPLAPARLVHERSGDLLTRSVSDVDSLEDFYIRVLVPPVVAVVVSAAVTISFGAFDLAMAAVFLLFLVLTGVILPLVSRWLSVQATTPLAATRGELGALVVDEISGLADLVAFGVAEEHRARLLAHGRAFDAMRRRSGTIEGISNALAGLFASLAGLAVLCLAIPLVTDGEVEGVFLAALPLAAIAAFEAVQPLSRSIQVLDSTRASARRLFELIDAPPPVEEAGSPVQPPDRPDLDVRGLTFRFEPHEPPVLADLDLRIATGERVALVGPSGSGKSTLVSLLLRFWDYDEGEIRLGGRELRCLALDDVRRMLSVVPQDVHLFNATIRDNLALADADATGSQMETACRIAQLHDVIAALPAGYDTHIGEDGLLLSGGERRRLAIARAVLKDAPFVILDEATADLDRATEAALWTALDRWLVGRTVLVISHQPRIDAQVDRVVRLSEGRIVAATTPGAGD